jgi:hypothetical protein
MSVQAYLDAIEESTGLTPRQLVEQARERGSEGPATKAGPVLAWLAGDHGLGRGHGMALVHVIENGPRISARHVRGPGPHRDGSDTLWLDARATKPA